MIRRIEVSGYGEASARPDTVEVGISVVFTCETPHEAQELTARTMEKMLAELRTIGIEEGETETTTYYVRPVYEWKKDSRVSKGYEGANELKIKTAKLHLLDSILAAVLKAGAKEIRYISFSCRDKQALEPRALQKATENARRRAGAKLLRG